MLDCHVCVQRCIRAVLAPRGTSSPALLQHTYRPLPASLQKYPPWRQHRGLATTGRGATAIAEDTEDVPRRRKTYSRDRGASPTPQENIKDPQRKDTKGGHLSRRNLEESLKYLKDPLKLADHVRFAIRDGKVEQATELVRAASKEMACTVSWNHLIAQEMGRGGINAALKLYNEMKKRGQTPDAYTFTLLLRGLAMWIEYPSALSKALSIYYSMFAPQSSVKPSLIHTNAVLKVCARGNDMDSVWAISAKLPEGGPGSPDSITWTTILDCIRENAITGKISDASAEDSARLREKAIMDGRRIWDDILGRWRKGNLWIDERLVCSMGQLLLIGRRPKDWDDVLSLVEQTMNIPRLVPRLGTSARPQIPVPQQEIFSPADQEGVSLLTHEHSTSASASASAQDGEEDNQFAPVKPTHRPKHPGQKSASQSLTYAVPGHRTLTTILTAANKMRSKQIGQAYWDLLTDRTTHGLRPDSPNVHAYLRLLRISRSSADSLTVLNDIAADPATAHLLAGKSFNLAMSACVRDKNNPNVFETATSILNLMYEKFPTDPDLAALVSYLDLAVSSDNPKIIQEALRRLSLEVVNVKSRLAYGRDVSMWRKGRHIDDLSKAKAEQLSGELVRKMVGAMDRLMNRGEIRREEYGRLTRERGKLAAFITRYGGGVDRERAEKAVLKKKIGRFGGEVHGKTDDVVRE
ncbi:MAG: hypothetical protein M1819_006469 [Sarea resinae]|nr:MAG: hypothetical protein M1819_006469 [Sarea resinae]